MCCFFPVLTVLTLDLNFDMLTSFFYILLVAQISIQFTYIIFYTIVTSHTALPPHRLSKSVFHYKVSTNNNGYRSYYVVHKFYLIWLHSCTPPFSVGWSIIAFIILIFELQGLQYISTPVCVSQVSHSILFLSSHSSSSQHTVASWSASLHLLSISSIYKFLHILWYFHFPSSSFLIVMSAIFFIMLTHSFKYIFSG